MDDLKTLIKLISKQKVKQIEIISENITLSPQTEKLYLGVLNGQYKTDEEAVLDIYNTKRKSESYKKLKYRLKQRLINTLFFIDVQAYSSSSYQKALMRNYKNASAIQILINKGAKGPAYSLAEITIKSAIQFELTDVIILLLPNLIRHYGIFNRNNSKYKKYSELLFIYQHIHAAELDAERLFVKAARLFLRTKSMTDGNEINILKKELELNEAQYKDVNSYKYRFASLSALFIVNLLKKNYIKMDEICQKAIAHFKEKKQFSKFPLFDFNLKHSVVHIYFKRYEKAIHTLEICQQLNINAGNYNWFIVNNYLLLVHILQRKYNQAYPIIAQVLNHRKFRSSYALYRQQWQVKEAYFQFLVEAKQIDTDAFPDIKFRKFKLVRFLNDVDEMIKDKKGMHIPVLIIEVLFLLLRKDIDQLEARLGALRQYNYRYLRKIKRSNAFIKMLTSVSDLEYNPIRIRKRIAKYYKTLEDTPMELTEQEIQIEIIPYEDLWEMVIEIVSRR